MKANGLQPTVINAGNANLFLSDFFAQCFANNCQTPLALYQNDGAIGAAIGAGIGAYIFQNAGQAFNHHVPSQIFEPHIQDKNEEKYQQWLLDLKQMLA
jgi:xylulokinase